MLQIKELTKKYGDLEALKKVSFTIKKGEFFGLLGPNGAGKTSLMNIISGILDYDSGQIIYKEKENYHLLHKEGIGVVPQEIALYDELSAIDNLKFWGGIYRIKPKQLTTAIDENLKLLGLYDRRKDKVKSFSGGMKRRLNIAAALLHQPELLLMDEPTVGVDPQSRNLIYELLEKLTESGKTIIYTSHYMDEVEKLCSKIAIIDRGDIIAEGSLDELRKQTKLKQSIRLKVDDESALSQGVIEAISEKHSKMEVNANEIVLFSDDTNKDLLSIVGICNDFKLNIINIEVEKANLQTIFLKLTGRELRD